MTPAEWRWTSRWTGPLLGELDAFGSWRGALPIPPDRWPYGPPFAHEDHCLLHSDGRWCDCSASDESDDDYGEGAWPTSPNATPKEPA